MRYFFMNVKKVTAVIRSAPGHNEIWLKINI